MYIIAVYDIEEKRVAKMLKLFRKYLTWVQNSVFEGELTQSQIQELKLKAYQMMNPEKDSIIFYYLQSEKYLDRETYGKEKSSLGSFI